MLTVFNAVLKSRDVLNAMLFNKNDQPVTYNNYETVNRLSNRYGAKNIIEYVEQRTLMRYLREFEASSCCAANGDSTSNVSLRDIVN
jgi:hypothetical protein